MASTYTTTGEVAAEIYQRLLGISVAGGYETDMGLLVFQGRVKVADEQIEKAGSCISVIEGIDTIQDQAGEGRKPVVKIEQRYGLVGYSVCDGNAPNLAAHKMLRDMKRAIFGGSPNWDNKVLKVVYKSRDIGPRSDGINIVQALLEIGVVFVEDLTNP